MPGGSEHVMTDGQQTHEDIPEIPDVVNVPIFPEDQPVSTSEESHVEDVDVPDCITNPDDEAQEGSNHGDK